MCPDLNPQPLQVRRIAAAPHSQEEAEAAMAASPKSDSVRSISLTGLRDPVPAADLAHQRSLTLQARRRQASPLFTAATVPSTLASTTGLVGRAAPSTRLPVQGASRWHCASQCDGCGVGWVYFRSSCAMRRIGGTNALLLAVSLQAGGKQSSFPGASAVQRGLSIFGSGRQSSVPGLQQPFAGHHGGSPTANLGPTAEVRDL